MKSEHRFLKWVADFYKFQLWNCDEALEYARSRVLDWLILDEFHVGLAGSYNELSKELQDNSEGLLMAKDLGLVKEGKYGLYDFFKERIIFPIKDEDGYVIAFAGRAFYGEWTVKYINSPGNDMFKKTETLYNLDKAIQSNKDYIILTEGYTDVMACHGADYDNAVATMGTAFSYAHAEQLSKYTNKLLLAFDNDTAGKEAMQSTLKVLKQFKFKVRMVIIPDGHDLDSYLKEHGHLGIIDENQIYPREFLYYNYLSKLENKHSSVSVEKIPKALKLLQGLPASVVRDILKDTADMLGLSYKALAMDMIELNRKYNKYLIKDTMEVKNDISSQRNRPSRRLLRQC